MNKTKMSLREVLETYGKTPMTWKSYYKHHFNLQGKTDTGISIFAAISNVDIYESYIILNSPINLAELEKIFGVSKLLVYSDKETLYTSYGAQDDQD